MAGMPVNPMLDTGPLPNYTGASNGVPPNTAYERLFNGIGSLVTDAANLTDNRNMKTIEQAVYRGYDEVNGEFGVTGTGEPTPHEPFPQQVLPDQAVAMGEYAQTLQEAAAAGTISEYHYWSRMQSLVQNLRTQYPTYRNEIDQMIAGVTGGTPANRLRDLAWQEHNSAQAESLQEQDQWETWVQNNAATISQLGLDVQTAYSGGYDQGRLRNAVAAVGADQANLAYENQLLAVQQGREEAIEDSVEGVAATQARNQVNQIVNSFLTAAQGTNPISFVEQVRQYQVDGFDETELAGLMTALTMAETNLETNVSNLMYNTVVGTGEAARTYAEILGPERTRTIIDESKRQIAMYRELLTNGDTGLIAWNLTMNEVQAQSDVRRLLSDPANDSIRLSKALYNMFPDATIFNWAMSGTTLPSKVNEAVSNLANMRLWTGVDSTLSGAVSYLEAKGIEKPEAVLDVVQTQLRVLTNPEALPEAVSRSVEILFAPANDGWFNQIAPADRRRVYGELTAPEVTNRLIEYRDSGAANAKQVFDAYSGFAANGLISLLRQDADTIQRGMETLRNVKITWNAGTNQFEYQIDPRFVPRGGDFRTAGAPVITGTGNSISDLIESRGIQEVVDRINNLNTALLSYAPIVQANGLDVSEHMAQMLQILGVDTSTVFKNTWYGELGTAIGEAVSNTLGADDVTPEQVTASEQENAASAAAGPLDTNFQNPPTEIVPPANTVPGSGSAEDNGQGVTPTTTPEEDYGGVGQSNPTDTMPAKVDEPVQSTASQRLQANPELKAQWSEWYQSNLANNVDPAVLEQKLQEAGLTVQDVTAPTNTTQQMNYAPEEVDRASIDAIFNILENRGMENLDDDEKENVQASLRTLRDYVTQGGAPPDGMRETTPRYWNPTSVERSAGVNPSLMSVVTRASELGGVQFVVGDHGGVRTQSEQNRLVSQGVSKTRNSNHLHGNAIDLIPINPRTGRPDPNWEEGYRMISQAMKKAAEEMGVSVEWGFEKWGWDMPHWQVPRG